ncbi:MAG: winged helix-turn-helix domain-containing protein [Alphaproteobacteria bacterium]|nr:winged helix-turn-helix domain-containing protein [Alphaproteobacteria bacterium]
MSDVLPLSAATVDLARREVRRDDGVVHPLSELEVALLAYLAARPGAPVPRDTLLVEVWGFPRPVPTRAVDNTVSRLRTKVEADPKAPDHLQTIRGRGYVLDLPTRASPAAPPVLVAHPRLAVPPAPFVGRTEELARLDELVGRRRLVTVLGPGGAGKTRLVAQWLQTTAQPVHLAVSLAHVTDRAGLVQAMADALQLPLSATDADHAVLARALGARGPGVVVLDNLEQLVGALPGTVDRWLREAPELHVVGTSRTVLGLAGEARMILAALDPADALELFRSRLRDADPDATLGEAERSQVVALLARVEHHPLCIELLASRVASLGVRAVADRLDSLLLGSGQLAAGPDDSLLSHRSLAATLRWSWDLLSPGAQGALAALSIAGGSFDLPLADEILGHDAASAVAELRQASLLERDASPGQGLRYHLLLPVREFARAQLVVAPDRDAVQRRFADAMLRRATAIDSLCDAARPAARIEASANLVAAGDGIVDAAPADAARLLLAGRDGDALLAAVDRPDPYERIVTLAERSGDRRLWAQARATLARWHSLRGDTALGLSLLQPVLVETRAGDGHPSVLLQLARVLSSRERRADASDAVDLLLDRSDATASQRSQALSTRAILHQLSGAWGPAETDFHAAIALAVRDGQPRAERIARANLASLLLRWRSRLDEARDQLQRARAIEEAWGPRNAWMENLLAWIDLGDERLADARRRANDALILARRSGDSETTQFCMGTLTWVALLEGDMGTATALLRDSLAITRQRGSHGYSAALLVSLAAAAARQRDLAAADAWLAALDGLDLVDPAGDLVAGIALERRIVDLAHADAAIWPGLVAEVRAQASALVGDEDVSYLALVGRLVEASIVDLDPDR